MCPRLAVIVCSNGSSVVQITTCSTTKGIKEEKNNIGDPQFIHHKQRLLHVHNSASVTHLLTKKKGATAGTTAGARPVLESD